MALKRLERRLQRSHGRRDGGRQRGRWRTQGGQTPLQTVAHRFQDANIGEHLAFRPLAQTFSDLLFLPGRDGFEQELRRLDHALAHRSRRALILREPVRQLPRRQWRLAQARKQLFGMRGVGARQRSEDANRRPGRHLPLTYGVEQGVR